MSPVPPVPPVTPVTRKKIKLRMSKAKDYLSQVKKKAKAVREQKELILQKMLTNVSDKNEV